MTLRLKNALLASIAEAWRLPPTLYSNWNVRGSYHPMRYVLRLRPDVHRALDPALTDEHSLEDRLQAFSTYLHETIHWWQHIGSTSGLILTLLHPAQLHYNKQRLDRIIEVGGPFKSLLKFNAQTVGAGIDPGPAGEHVNVVLNNWHDAEFFRHLVSDTRAAEQCVRDPYFNGVAHSFEIAIGSVLWLLSATFDPHMQLLPDPRNWEAEFGRLRAAREPGFHASSDVYLPPFGVRAIFEGQARFSQLQYLHAASGGKLTWEDCEQGGYLHGIYLEAFDGFLQMTGAECPKTLDDPIVGLFLLVCDLAMNPTEGFPCDLLYVPAFVQSVDPGFRFMMLSQWIGQEGKSLLGAVTRYSKDEYLEISSVLCGKICCDPPARVAEVVGEWSRTHAPLQQLLTEDETFAFSAGNLPVRVFFARFLSFQRDKLENPQFFCWPGMWSAERSGTWSLEDARRLFNRHEALFIDRPDGDVYPRLPPGKDSASVERTFNDFYAMVAAYELTRQWIVQEGPFDHNFPWLTSQYPNNEVRDWASRIFERSFGVRPEAVRIL